MKSCGICLGAANLSIVEIQQDSRPYILNTLIRPHEGKIKEVLGEEFKRLLDSGFEYIALTGRKIRNFVNLPWISEPQACELAFAFVNRDNQKIDAIVNAGAELFIAYILDKEGRIHNVRTGNKCASGTGEFFLQQIRRMNISLDEAINIGRLSKIHRISGRCSVFCKSDATHALNRGISIGEICAGLCEMMAKKILELLVNVPKNNIMLTGGVSQNLLVTQFLKKYVSHLIVPPEAPYFEALGAALWAKENKVSYSGCDLFKESAYFFKYKTLKPLEAVRHLVNFKLFNPPVQIKGEKRCILGLDVGSTTTKAVILRLSDDAILASVYLRTNGNPVEASRNCYYRLLAKEIKEPIEIIGLGVTGSGRQIASIHASTDGVVNEIIAHATAALYFDKDVDTIFEIGGQDAKYTYITHGVPSDYAMNEACSAGTGSFLEESCKETLGIDVDRIADIALSSKNPPNFNDQCAAFISSDIKTACQEGLLRNDIVAGLVYSICINYNNRVRGLRPIGNKIFLQGGVCYNQAVPLAIASLLDKQVVVPPQPGLMGAFGAALEIKKRIASGLLPEGRFDLNELIERKVIFHLPFRCKGQTQNCDRNCEIASIEVAGKIHPFGGACNKYYNLRYELKFDVEKLNLVKWRQAQLFKEYTPPNLDLNPQMPSVGINKSFLTHLLFPLYYNFFTRLGMRAVLPDSVKDYGRDKIGSSFCYPVEIAHGCFQDLLEKKPDYIFLPHISELKSKNTPGVRKEQQSTCVILQGESYYLISAFKDMIEKNRILNPVLDFSKGIESQESVFLGLMSKLGLDKRLVREAFRFACLKQEGFLKDLKLQGRRCLAELEANPQEIAIVIFGRSYNAFSQDANMAIPDKFASRGILTLPFDCLPFEQEQDDESMHWECGEMLLKAAKFVKSHPQLFAAFITNFSCGPDSFILGYVREIMAKKPMLTLELDSHTQDVGLTTRIEAFLEIIKGFRGLKASCRSEAKDEFIPAECKEDKGKTWVISSDKKRFRIDNQQVKVLIPAMGRLGPEALASVFRGIGIDSVALPVSDNLSWNYGRGQASCKECLPLILSAGALLRYLKEYPQNGKILVYFMPTTGGNCRFGQYNVFLKNLIKRQRITNLAVWSLDTQNSYIGLGAKFISRALKATIVSDVMYDIKNALKVLAIDREEALKYFDEEWQKIIHLLEGKNRREVSLYRQLEQTALSLRKIPLRYPLNQAKLVALMGEIYVRRDDFCCNALIERLAERGIILKTASGLEWLYYIDYLIKKSIIEADFNIVERLGFVIKNYLQRKYEKTIKAILAQSGLYHNELVNIEEIMHYGRTLINERLTGESIVVVGAALKEIGRSVCGIINIGPFACLPTRIIEAILSKNMDWPFLSLEIDGGNFPTLIDAKIETFCLQVERAHKRK